MANRKQWMKKLISVCLCALITVCGFGERGQADELLLAIGTNTFTVAAGETVMGKFIPEEDGEYVFETEGDYDTFGSLYNAELDVLEEDDDNGINHNFKIRCSLTAGVTYYIGTRFFGEDRSGDVTLNVSPFVPASDSGSCGENAEWTLDNCTLTVSGTGDIGNYEACSAPWYIYRDEIRDVVIEEGITGIGDYAFYDMVKLVSVSIPANVTAIGAYSFAYASVESAVIPENVASIGERAFNDCQRLESVSIPAGTRYIGPRAFSGCDRIKEFTVAAGNAYYTEADGMLFTKDMKTLLSCPGGRTEAYEVPNGVETIAEGAFYRCGIEAVTIPDSVTILEEDAFWNCYNLESVTIPANVASIGNPIFSYCHSLVSFTVDPDNTHYTAVDGALFTKDMKTLITVAAARSFESYTVPDGVQVIGGNAFASTENLKEVTISDSVTRIEDWAFFDCWNLVRAVIPSSVKTIEDHVFEGCGNLTIVCDNGSAAMRYAMERGIPFELTGNTDEDFEQVYPGTTDIYVAAGETVWLMFVPEEDDNYVFESESDDDTYGDLFDAQYVRLASDDDNGRDNNFRIRYDVVAGETYYLSVRFLDTRLNGDIPVHIAPYTPASDHGTCGENVSWDLENGMLTVSGTGDMEDYGWSGDTPWGDYRSEIYEIVVEEGVTGIGDSAFSDMEQLVSVSLPQGLTRIGRRALAGGCLESITIPGSVTDIGESAFEGDWNLTAVAIPAAVRNIGLRAFAYCSSLSAITVDKDNPCYTVADGVLFTKDMKTLLRCSAGKTGSYTIPAGVESIEDAAFANSEVTSITIPDSVTSIAADAFSECSELTAITIPKNVEFIGEGAFTYCNNLRTITVDSDNPYYTSADGILFTKDMKALVCYPSNNAITEYTVPDGVERIENRAFASVSVKKIVLPDTMTRIGDAAFNGCYNLRSVMIPNSVKSFGYDVFWNCDRLTVTCGRGSAAMWYAAANGVAFELTEGSEIQAEQVYMGNNTVAVPAGETVTLIFVPEKDGTYVFESESEGDTYGYLYDGQLELLAEDDDGGESNNFRIEYPLTAGETYYLRVRFYDWKRSGNIILNIRSDSSAPTSGTCGPDAEWTLENGTLTVTGTGSIDSYMSDEDTPWSEYRGEIRRVIIRDGITGIGDNAFNNCPNLSAAWIPDSVTYIDGDAFTYCPNLTIWCSATGCAAAYARDNRIPMGNTENTAEIKDLKYGEAAWELAMAEQPITATFRGTVYSFDDFPGTFKNEIRMYGGNTHAVTEVTVPNGATGTGESEDYLGTIRIDDCFGEGPGTLRILAGNRETGVYAVSSEITLNGAYREGIYFPRDTANNPILVDRIYLLTYKVGGEIVHKALSLYIDYENVEAEHEPLETSLEHINDGPAPVINFYDDSHSEPYNMIADSLRMKDIIDYNIIFWAFEEGETYRDLADLFASYGKTFPRSIVPATDDNRRITSLGSSVRVSGLHFGDEAWQLFVKGEANEFELGGRVYSLSDFGGNFEGKTDLYGGNTLSVVEVTVPETTKVDRNLLIGTYSLNVNDTAALYILEGNRNTGEYAVRGPLMLTGDYSENLYANQVAGVNCPTDKIYLSVTEECGMMRCRAMSIYIDYEDSGEGDIGGSVLNIPEGVVEIEEEAFMNVAAASIVVPEGVQTIGPRAFANSAVKVLVLPDSLESVDFSIVEGCGDLQAIICSTGNAAARELAEHYGLNIIYR